MTILLTFMDLKALFGSEQPVFYRVIQQDKIAEAHFLTQPQTVYVLDDKPTVTDFTAHFINNRKVLGLVA